MAILSATDMPLAKLLLLYAERFYSCEKLILAETVFDPMKCLISMDQIFIKTLNFQIGTIKSTFI